MGIGARQQRERTSPSHAARGRSWSAALAAGVACCTGLLTAGPATAACAPRTSTYSSAVTATAGLISYFRLGESAGSTVACPSAGASTGTYTGGVSPGQSGAP